MRSFLAIPLPDDVRDALQRVQNMLPVGRPVARGNLHLTLAFLGDQPEDRLEELHFELEGRRHAPIDLSFSGLGCFGREKPRLVFADVAPAPALLSLARDVLNAARRVGMVPDKGRYHPHVTLARLGQGGADAGPLFRFLEMHGGMDLPCFRADSFTLFRSDLHPKGARYLELANYPLT